MCKILLATFLLLNNHQARVISYQVPLQTVFLMALALSSYIHQQSLVLNLTTVCDQFFPQSWTSQASVDYGRSDESFIHVAVTCNAVFQCSGCVLQYSWGPMGVLTDQWVIDSNRWWYSEAQAWIQFSLSCSDADQFHRGQGSCDILTWGYLQWWRKQSGMN